MSTIREAIDEARANRETCECGQPGVHPYPIGGGWAMACDACKADSVRASFMRVQLGTGSYRLIGEGHAGETWDAWRVAAFGCEECDCADPTALSGLASECECECHAGGGR